MFKGILLIFVWCAPLLAETPIQPGRVSLSDFRDTRSPNFPSCLQSLARIFDTLEERDVLAVNVGGRRDLAELLIHSGWSQTDVNQVNDYLALVRHSRLANLRSVANGLELPANEDQIFICLISRNCVIAHGSEGRLVQPTANYEVVPNFSGNLIGQRPIQGSAPRGIEAAYNAIQLTMQASTHRGTAALSFVATLYHEARHVLDVSFLSSWIIANRRLINAGQAPGPLFSRYVRILNPGLASETIVVMQCFEKAWLEPRAYQISSQAYHAILVQPGQSAERRAAARELHESFDSEFRQNAFTEVTDQPGGADLLRAHRITEANIYRIGPILERLMQADLDRAAALPL